MPESSNYLFCRSLIIKVLTKETVGNMLYRRIRLQVYKMNLNLLRFSS